MVATLDRSAGGSRKSHSEWPVLDPAGQNLLISVRFGAITELRSRRVPFRI